MAKLISYWWENDHLYIETDEGTIELNNPYISNIKFHGLEYDSNEEVTIVGNNKTWDK